MSRWRHPTTWKFDIDHHLNPFVPLPPWNRIPYPIAYFLGHRKQKPRDIGTVVPILWAFVGIFCGISIIEVVSERIPSFKSHNAPMIVGSFGAGAVLEFYAIESPLAQPRNFLGGQMIAAILGVGICKLFQMSVYFVTIRWLAGALSCAVVVAIMGFTKTVHPPAGATALLAVVDDQILRMGWFFVPVVLLNCAIMLAVALLINNVQRAFPVYWWTPDELPKRDPGSSRALDVESKGGASEEELKIGEEQQQQQQQQQQQKQQHPPQHKQREIIIRPGRLTLPDYVYLMQEELQLLEEISNRL